jgi:DNA modification methylase
MYVEIRPIDRPVAYSRNPRKVSDGAIDKVAASLKEFSFRQPLVVDSDGVIIVGHTRLLAARKLGLREVPVHVATGLTPAQIRAYRIMDNRSHEEASWDNELLSLELADLSDLASDLSLTGFDEDELSRLLTTVKEGLTDENEAPPLPEKPVSRPGDVWLLRNHRLVVGDSTDPAVVAKGLKGVRPHLMVTDPPYGVLYDPGWRTDAGVNKQRRGAVANDERVDWSEAWALFPGSVAYVWHAGKHAAAVQQSLEKCGFEVRSQIIWAKNRIALSRGHYHWMHEPLWYAVRKGGDAVWVGDRSQSTLWRIDVEKLETGHGTQKPVECMRRPIANNSSPGQAIYEPFSGSGTTIIAAEQTERVCHAIELDPAYADVAVLRWQAFSGKEATLESTGEAFASTKQSRGEWAASPDQSKM